MSTPQTLAALDGLSVSELVRVWARVRPDADAFITADSRRTWSDYDRCADAVHDALRAAGAAGHPVAVFLPDTMVVHAALCGAYRAGSLAVGIGSRSGLREVAHLMVASGSTNLITSESVWDAGLLNGLNTLWTCGAAPQQVVLVNDDGRTQLLRGDRDGYDVVAPRELLDNDVAPASFGIDDVSMLNSTSGTTGLPKLVMQHDARWLAFAGEAIRAGDLTGDELVLGLVPAPFGFGLWTTHYMPALLGVPVVTMERFSVVGAGELLGRLPITFMACVSTQFKLLLRHAEGGSMKWGSLRTMFTGGEPVPYAEARDFEQRTGALVLQFYGSNESGAVSCTTVHDTPEIRLRTCGRVLTSMNVKVFDASGDEVTGAVRRGQPGVNGPLMTKGYWNDEQANTELRSRDGWVKLSDIVEIDADGVVRVVGRVSDIIIRGGQNISAADVEEKIGEHPAVDMAAVVGVPDPIFGERVCAVVVLQGGQSLTLPALAAWLRSRGVSKDSIPELLDVAERLPTNAGGKIAKNLIRQGVLARIDEIRGRAR